MVKKIAIFTCEYGFDVCPDKCKFYKPINSFILDCIHSVCYIHAKYKSCDLCIHRFGDDCNGTVRCNINKSMKYIDNSGFHKNCKFYEEYKENTNVT